MGAGDHVIIKGEAGKDIIRSDYFQQVAGYDNEERGDEWLYGDYSYGERGVDYYYDNDLENTSNIASRRLNQELWGDDDKIYGGDNTEFDFDQYIVGGDGDDIIHQGNLWEDTTAYGSYGDDIIYGPTEF